MARIMVVDDERDVVTLIKFLLEKEGHEIEGAHNGQDALKALGVDPRDDNRALPDLVILDVMMPIVDGYTVCTKMAQSPRFKDVPVLILTAKGQMRELFSQAGNVSAYLEKPFDPKNLREVVKKIVSA